MNVYLRGSFLCVVLALALPAFAHGPQIQITNDNGKIVTRELFLEGPYSSRLSSPKSVYVMPIQTNGGVWYSHPNDTIDPVTSAPAYPSGPGLAYGYDFLDGGPQAFAANSVLSVGFTAGLKRWDGAMFADAGATEIKAFRGSNPDITTPPENFAITSDAASNDSVSLPAVVADYGTEGTEVHNSIRFALLGDGSQPTSDSPDGVYLLSLEISSTQTDLSPSDPYYFVLHKNAVDATVSSAVNSLGVSPDRVQFVPEPNSLLTLLLAVSGGAGLIRGRVRSR
jgi:hypothetical protein